MNHSSQDKDINSIEACHSWTTKTEGKNIITTYCPSQKCIRNKLHHKQMWFSNWVKGLPELKKGCPFYLPREEIL